MEVTEPNWRLERTEGTGRPGSVLIIEVDPDNPVVADPIVVPAGTP
jgi:hypothetical protein